MYSRKFPLSSRRAMFAVPEYWGNHVGMTRTHEEVGQSIRQIRLTRRMSPPELARAAGVDPKTVRALESGERWPQDTSRAKIEAALKLPPGALDNLLAGGSVSIYGSGRASKMEPPAHGAVMPPRRAQEDPLTDEQFRDMFNRWSALYVQSVQLEWEYSRARGIPLSKARDELVATISMASQAKEDRPWTPPWENYPDGYEPWDEAWWEGLDNRERFHYWLYGEVGLHPEFRKLHPEYLGWPTKVPAGDPDDPANYDLAAHPSMEIAADRLDSEFDQLGEENQDPDH